MKAANRLEYVRSPGEATKDVVFLKKHEEFIKDVLYPLSFDGPSEKMATQNPIRQIQLVIDFFQAKGLETLKREDQQESWYTDWLDYQSRHGIYASLLCPAQYSNEGHQFRLSALAELLEVFAYFSPAHAYSLHTSFLGLFPILMSSNEELKKEALAALGEGKLLAFGVSERAHGSDLFANEFTVRRTANGWLANGAKCYIGNANAAAIISILAKQSDTSSGGTTKRAPFVFFAHRAQRALRLRNLRKVRTLGIRSAFVGEFEVEDYEFPERDVISQGRDAWDAVLSTVTFGKFLLGFGSVGICEHAFTEAIRHLYSRVLYGKPVLQMSHLRETVAMAFARLTAMKFYAFRALDYLQAACENDRRYLLFNAVQKAKVSTEGVKVMGLLSESVGARGFEADTYFESALRDMLLVPGLEGSTHINYAVSAQFIANYFADGHDVSMPASVVPGSAPSDENPYWFKARDRNVNTVRFAGTTQAYEALGAVPNVRRFREQVETFQRLTTGGGAALNPSNDIGLNIAIGKCFSIVVYAQLVAENCVLTGAPAPIVSIIFHGLIEDLSIEALRLCARIPAGSAAKTLRAVVQVPEATAAELASALEFINGRSFM